MIRFNIVRNLLVASVLVMGGCAAQSSSSSDGDPSANPLNPTEIVAMDGNGSSHGGSNAERSAGGPAPVGIETAGPTGGPQPEPWNGGSSDDDRDQQPQPEPWRPKKIAPEPDPASASSTPPKP